MAKILHVEDHPDWRSTVARGLKAAGHKVSSFSEMAKAKTAYEKGGFDLVICDGSINTPGDGVAWAEELHASGQKVVVLSGNAETEVPFVSKGNFDIKKILSLLK